MIITCSECGGNPCKCLQVNPFKWLETNLFFDTFLEKPYGVWISLWQWLSNYGLYSSHIVLPDFKWGIIDEDTTFNGVKK